MTITFIVPARNEELHIKACLTSIESQVNFDGRSIGTTIIVVDNQSNDRTKLIAAESNAKVISNQISNAGTTRNVGARLADSEFLAFIDADCVLPKYWVAQCVKHFEESNVVAVGASQAYSGNSAPWIERCWTDIISPTTDSDWQSVDWLPAFNLITRSKTFHNIRGFDESLETCEDSDLTMRLANHGELRLDHRVRVRHLGESKSVSEFIRREMWRSKGNFRSALKRRKIRQEIISLFAPTAYAALILLSVASPLLTFINYRVALSTFGLATLISLALPLLIAARKGRHENLFTKAFAISAYMIARGTGPFTNASRISYRKN